MNKINILQNEQKQIEKLAAQRELYSSAKNMHLFQIIITVLIPIILSVISVYDSDIASYAAAFGLFAAIFDMLIIENVIKNRQEKAAKIQELFDCAVLSLIPSPLKKSKEVAIEEILFFYEKHKKNPKNIDILKDWYPKNIGHLPLHIARIICQRENCWWDSKLRERYIKIINGLALFILVGLLFFAQWKDIKFTDIIYIGSAILPFFQFCIKQNNDHKTSKQRLNELVLFAKDLWDNALEKSKSEEVITESSRRLQDEIFEHRSNSPLILDIFYNNSKNKDENLVMRSTEILLEEVENKK